MGLSNKLSCEAGSFSHRYNPLMFLQPAVLGFLFPCWNPGLLGLSHSPFVPPGLSSWKCGTAWSSSHRPAQVLQLPPCRKSSLPQLPISAPPTGLDECFFFNSLVFRLPYSLIFWQFCLFFIFKFVVVLLLVVGEGSVSTYASILVRSQDLGCKKNSKISFNMTWGKLYEVDIRQL